MARDPGVAPRVTPLAFQLIVVDCRFHPLVAFDAARVVAGAPALRLALHFAGEPTSINNQGFLDGAVETGVRVAKEIFAEL